MTLIDRTAYPRFKQYPSAKELTELYTPTPSEIKFVKSRVRSHEGLLGIYALKFVLDNEHKRGKYLPFEINLDFISNNWRTLVIKELEGTKALVRQQLEICVFSYLATD